MGIQELSGLAPILQDRAIGFLCILFGLPIMVVLWEIRILSLKRKKIRLIYDLKPSRDQIKKELRKIPSNSFVHFVVVLVFCCLGLPITPQTPSLIDHAFSMTVIVAITDLWYYISHRLMHTKQLWFLHQEHHQSRLVTTSTAFRFFWGEKVIFSVGLLGIYSFISLWIPLTWEVVPVLYVVYYWWTVREHSNVEDTPWLVSNFLTRNCLSNAAYHALHHSREDESGNYAGMLTIWDWLFGTQIKDSYAVLQRVEKNIPLGSLEERA
jgi:sterol desaturase/sphingolipid hydroxylase (fatty acid hydroxylase superfamily)